MAVETRGQVSQDVVVQLAEERLAPRKAPVGIAVLKWLFRSAAAAFFSLLVMQIVSVAASVMGPIFSVTYPWLKEVIEAAGKAFSGPLGLSLVSPLSWLAMYLMVILYSAVARPRLPGNGWAKGFIFGALVWALGLFGSLVSSLSHHGSGSKFYVTVMVAALGFVYAILYGLAVGGAYEWSVEMFRAGAFNDFFLSLVKAMRLDQTEWFSKLARPRELWAYFQARRRPNGYAMVTMVRRFAIMWKASIPVGRILKVLAEQETDVPLQSALTGTLEALQNGKSISAALSMFPNTFNPLFVGMCRVGESTGRMDGMLQKLADYLERDFRLKKKVQAALTYPGFVFGVAVIVAWGIFTYIVPTLLATILELAGPSAQLPLPTLVLRALVDFTQNPRVQVFAVLGVLWMTVWFKEFVKTPTGRQKFDEFLCNMWLVGPLNRKVILTRFCLAFGTLIGAGVPVLMCVELLLEIIDNEYFKKACIIPLYKGVRAGQNLSVLATEIDFFPDMFCRMIAVAEESGEFDAMLSRLGNFYDIEVQYALEMFLTMIEPIMIFVMGIIVCFVLLSVFLPLYQVVMSIH
ncbi:MAG TPA: type II secretion system F family protein [Candidatus Xenobia bacterium]|jgi:type II secretory pathway component PulF